MHRNNLAHEGARECESLRTHPHAVTKEIMQLYCGKRKRRGEEIQEKLIKRK